MINSSLNSEAVGSSSDVALLFTEKPTGQEEGEEEEAPFSARSIASLAFLSSNCKAAAPSLWVEAASAPIRFRGWEA